MRLLKTKRIEMIARRGRRRISAVKKKRRPRAALGVWVVPVSSDR